jgi:shikimate 5-dehydrogenase
VAVVGYGGAGKAAASAAKDMGLEVQVFNRSDHGLAFIRPLTELPLAHTDLLIYTLPMLVPEMQSWMDAIRSGAVAGPLCCIEANYRDPVLAPDRDKVFCFGEYIPGEKWLLAQAVTGYEILTGEKPRF